MKKEIFVDINPYQTRVVLAEDGVPSEVYIERRGRERLVGNIYKGKVQNVLPGMQAAFVDIGLERNAFLYAGDIQTDKSEFTFNGEVPSIPNGIPNIRDIVKVNQEIMVQIVKEPVGTKGARVTTNITLPGRTLVLMPSVSYIGVSRRIGSDKECGGQGCDGRHRTHGRHRKERRRVRGGLRLFDEALGAHLPEERYGRRAAPAPRGGAAGVPHDTRYFHAGNRSSRHQ